MQQILDIVQSPDDLSREEAMGFQGYSPLMDYPGFDFILGLPCEYLHHLCLGVTKRMVELTFKV